jgi:hypothetical protein
MLTYELPVDEQTNDIHDNWIALVEYDPDAEIMPKIVNLNTGEDMIKWYMDHGGKDRLQLAVDGFVQQIESEEYDDVTR